jgi:hypothetical protein
MSFRRNLGVKKTDHRPCPWQNLPAARGFAALIPAYSCETSCSFFHTFTSAARRCG